MGSLVLETENEQKLRRDQSYRDGIELQVYRFPPVQQQHYQEAAVFGRVFLTLDPLRSVLVESDDFTQAFVAALLPNCKYEEQAWSFFLYELNKLEQSSGSGSGSGRQSQRSVHSESNKISGNPCHSNEQENHEIKELNSFEGRDNGSGAQRSWTKRPPEAEGSKTASPLDQVAERLDRTSAEDGGTNGETYGPPYPVIDAIS